MNEYYPNNKNEEIFTSGYRRRNKNKPDRILFLYCTGIVLFILLALYCGYILEGCRFLGFVNLCITGVLSYYCILHLFSKRYHSFVNAITLISNIILTIAVIIASITEFYIIYAGFGVGQSENADYLIILGAEVLPDGISEQLRERIDRAYQYMAENPGTIGIASGGKETDKIPSEAKIIVHELVSRGISADRLWVEDRAASTRENLLFSLELIHKNGNSGESKITVLSSEFHLLRAQIIANKLQIKCSTVPAKTADFSLRCNHFLREIVNIWRFILFGI